MAWQVYFGLPANVAPSEESPYYVGAMALFGQGIRDASHDKFEPAHFAFPINKAVLAGLKAAQERWSVSFVPRGILVEGKPATPKVASPVKIGSLSLTVETHKSGPSPK